MIGAIICTPLAILYAQKPAEIESSPLPSGALLVRAPSLARWQITSSSESAPSASPAAASSLPQPSLPRAAEVRQITVTKSGMAYYREVLFDDSSELDEWWVAGVQVTQKKGHPGLLVSHQTGDLFYMNFVSSDFPEFDWIGPKTYIGIQKLGGRKCLVFKSQIQRVPEVAMRGMSPEELMSAQKDLQPVMAWIDLETRLPLQFATEGKKETYTFLLPSSGPLVLPSAVEKEIIALAAIKAQANRRAPHP